jgi:hypothetical protein
MVLDVLGLVSNGQQVTADAASTNVIDLGNVSPKRKIGTGEPVGFVIAISAIGTNTGSAVFYAASSAADTLGTPTYMSSVSLVTADIAVGRFYFVPIPPGQPILRYVGVYYDITGTVDFTVKACLIPQSFFQEFTAYAKNYTIS